MSASRTHEHRSSRPRKRAANKMTKRDSAMNLSAGLTRSRSSCPADYSPQNCGRLTVMYTYSYRSLDVRCTRCTSKKKHALWRRLYMFVNFVTLILHLFLTPEPRSRARIRPHFTFITEMTWFLYRYDSSDPIQPSTLDNEPTQRQKMSGAATNNSKNCVGEERPWPDHAMNSDGASHYSRTRRESPSLQEASILASEQTVASYTGLVIHGRPMAPPKLEGLSLPLFGRAVLLIPLPIAFIS